MTDLDTSDRDVHRAIRSWLHEDRHEDASRIAGAVLDQIETTPQRRGTWWPARRLAIMNKYVPIAVGAAAVVVAVVVGAQLLGGPAPGGVGVAPTASPSATPSPTPVPSVAEPSVSADTDLPVGSSFVFIDEGGVRGTVTVPAPGWTGEGGIMVKNESGADPPDGAGMITFLGDLYVYGDPCEWSASRPDIPATTVDELVVALSAQASREASTPVDVTVGGYAGKSITLHVPDDAVFSECDEGTFGSWGMAGSDPSPFRYHQGPGQIDELWILDLDGVLTVIDTAYYAVTPTEHVMEMRAIVESASFE